jgi:DNA processing protein
VVIAGGFDYLHRLVNPAVCRSLAEQNQWIVTEMPPDIEAQKWSFPLRNRIIAGLSQAVVVAESRLYSGSHITAQLAADYGRTVCAVPGPITHPSSQGTQWLINQGAVLVSSGQEVAEESGLSVLAQFQSHKQNHPTQPVSKPQEVLLKILQAMPKGIDELVAETGRPIEELMVDLTNLSQRAEVIKRGSLWLRV